MVSIHAPTKGATEIEHGNESIKRCFNPRSHEGSDMTAQADKQNKWVSIHAPTKGATHGVGLI